MATKRTRPRRTQQLDAVLEEERRRQRTVLVQIYFRGVGGSVFSAIPERRLEAKDLRTLVDAGLVELRDGLACLTDAGRAARDARG